MKTLRTLQISLANLSAAIDLSIAIPAATGFHLGRGFRKFPLQNLAAVELGNDKFTKVYFTTSSGNAYKIYTHHKRDFRWVLVNARADLGCGGERRNIQILGHGTIMTGEIEVGEQFHYNGGRTTRVTGIVAVNASRCYSHFPFLIECGSNIRNEFEKFIK